jgi:hypothetical protein
MTDVLHDPFAASSRATVEDALIRLTHARELLDEPHHWTQRTYARDLHGAPTDYRGPNAVCFCALGAVNRSADDDETAPSSWAIHVGQAAARVVGTYVDAPVASWNDRPGRTHAEVVAAFDATIAACEQRLAETADTSPTPSETEEAPE